MIQTCIFSEEELLEVQQLVRGLRYTNMNGDPGQVLYLSYIPGWITQRLTPEGYESKISFARLNTSELDTKFRVHADSRTRDAKGQLFYPDFACVFYPFDTPGHGTGLFRHKVLGDQCDKRKARAFTYDDGNWEMYDWYEGKENTMFAYESNKYHCRYPYQSFGLTKEDARIVIVNFMTKKE